MRLNKVQRAAYELIQADARFLYTLVDMSQNASNISSNYIMMCQPYIGIFADGAEQWCKKLGLKAPLFNEQEKNYYDALRQSHKLLEKTYSEYANLLMSKLAESDQYFYSIRSLREKVFGLHMCMSRNIPSTQELPNSDSIALIFTCLTLTCI